MRKIAIIISLVIIVGGISAIIITDDPTTDGSTTTPINTPTKSFEDSLAEKDVVLIESMASKPQIATPLVIRTYSAEQLAKQPLYLKKPGNDAQFILFAGTPNDLPKTDHLRPVNSSLVLACSDDAVTCVADGTPVQEDYSNWDAYWISPKTISTAPEAQTIATKNVIVKDGFMRSELEDGNWRVAEGTWKMKKHGGGMATSEEQVKSYNFQRAVNPFSVTGHGVLTYGDLKCAHNRGQANVYFGKPWRVGAVDKKTIPKGLILTAFGSASGKLIGFGWDGRVRKFGLLKRDDPGAEWTMIEERVGPRPPISNWVNIGIQIRNGMIIEGVLDGQVVLKTTLKKVTTGTFHVVTTEHTEFDDFAIGPINQPESLGAPVHVRSKQFAGKSEKNRSDPEEFGKWARGESAFIKTSVDTDDGRFIKAVLLSRWPMMGDFHYASMVHGSGVNGNDMDLPSGMYEFELLTNPRDGLPIFQKMTSLFKRRLIYDEDGWSIQDDEDGIAKEPVLKIRRTKDAGNVIEIQIGDSFQPASYRIDGPVHVAISRVLPRSSNALHPKPENHVIHSKNLVNELFESTPVNWSWIDGGFRMDCRWACQNRWNFMACGSRDMSMLVSKRRFFGDQEHEYFMSLRPVFPSDAGDPSFTWSQSLHRELLMKFGGWYVRRDLCFSFCMDGRNPLSGYSVVFGGKENTETQLIRKGKIVATNRSALFPKSSQILDVHWEWWALSVRKYGGRIIVLYKDKPILDYTDPEPLSGGHLAFWTVRNGFTVSKVVSTAQRLDWDPDVLYVKQDVKSPWQPLVPDGVTISKADDDCVKVTANVGGGSAIRYNFRPPIIIKRTPVLTLPLRIPKDVKVNLHLHIDDKARMIQISAPISHTKALLTPEFEPDYNFWIKDRREMYEEMRRNEFFQIPEIPESTMKNDRLLGSVSIEPDTPLTVDISKLLGSRPGALLRSITIGNSSNEDYLLVGNGANAAGSSFIVGEPTFEKAESP